MPDPALFTSVINGYLPEPHASLLNGILFGIPLKTSKIFYERLKIVGLLHIVVLSGINVTILAAIVGSFTRFLNKKLSVFISIASIVLFVIFVGAKPPIVRAGVMGILTLVAIIFGRKALPLYLLFLSAFLTSIFWPRWIGSLSFQLSYGATLGIILFGQVHESKNFLWKDLKPSLAAQLFTAPIIFFSFHQISFIAPLSNLLVSAVIPPLMIFGFLTAILGKIHFLLGVLPAYTSYGLLSYIVFVVEFLSRAPFAFHQF